VNNDGLHGMRQKHGKKHLNAGTVKVTVWFFERGGGAGLHVYWSGPGIGRRVMTSSRRSQSTVLKMKRNAKQKEATKAKEVEGKRAKRSIEFGKLVAAVQKAPQYVLPSDYAKQFFQIDLCNAALLLKDDWQCSDRSLEHRGWKSTFGCNAKTQRTGQFWVRAKCPSCACTLQSVTAVATQGNPAGQDLKEHEWVSDYFVSYLTIGKDGRERWMFYSSGGGSAVEMTAATILRGGSSKDDVQKNFFEVKLSAKAIRIHPMCWVGRSMALRVEVFQCLQEFSWKNLQAKLGLSASKALARNTDATNEMARNATFTNATNEMARNATSADATNETARNATSTDATNEMARNATSADATNETRGMSQGRRGGGGQCMSMGFFNMLSSNRAGNSEDDEDEDVRLGEAAIQMAETNMRANQKVVGGDKVGEREQVHENESAEYKLTCNTILAATAGSFDKWTLGMGGSGAVYQTEAKKIMVGSKEYTFHAYQRRVVQGAGLLQKGLVCFTSPDTNMESCCVKKHSEMLATIWPQQILETKLM